VPGDFTDLLAWQEASALVADVQEIASRLKGIGATDAAAQLISAAESISANIAEGYGRGFGRDYCRFLRIAIGSATEVENRLHIAVTGRRIAARDVEKAIKRTRRARALTTGFLGWLERELKKGKA